MYSHDSHNLFYECAVKTIVCLRHVAFVCNLLCMCNNEYLNMRSQWRWVPRMFFFNISRIILFSELLLYTNSILQPYNDRMFILHRILYYQQLISLMYILLCIIEASSMLVKLFLRKFLTGKILIPKINEFKLVIVYLVNWNILTGISTWITGAMFAKKTPVEICSFTSIYINNFKCAMHLGVASDFRWYFLWDLWNT